MVSLVQIAGTDEQFLVEGQGLQDILNGYNKYAGATSIYNEFNTNLPDGFLDSDLDALLKALAEQSKTPAGPSYSGLTQAVYKEDTRGDGEQKTKDAYQEDTFDYTQGDANKLLEESVILSGGFGGVIKKIFGGSEAADEQQKLSDAVIGSYEEDRSLSQGMEDIGTLGAGLGKHSGVMTAFLGALTMDPMKMAQGLYGHRANTETERAYNENFRGKDEKMKGKKPDDDWKISYNASDLNMDKISFGEVEAGYKAADEAIAEQKQIAKRIQAQAIRDSNDRAYEADRKKKQDADTARKVAAARSSGYSSGGSSSGGHGPDRSGSANQQNNTQTTRGEQTRSWNSGM